MTTFNTQVMAGAGAQPFAAHFNGVFFPIVTPPTPPEPCPPCDCGSPVISPVVVVPPSGHALERVRDLRYDDHTAQLVLVGGDLTLTYDLDAVRQACELALTTFRGEWFLDTSAGTPWFQNVLVKAPRIEAIKQILRSILEAVPGVNAVTKLDLVFNRGDRSAAITFTCSSDFGELTGTVEQEI